jgi:hypothetical protein
MTGEQILSITKVGDLFSNDLNLCKSEYHELAKIWHPDVTKTDTKDIFQKINDLYERACILISEGHWEKTNYIQIKTTTGKINLNYLFNFSFELGEAYICNKHIVYIFDSTKEKYYKQMKSSLKLVKYANSDMEKEFKRYFPKIIAEHKTSDGKLIIVIEKTEDVYPLSLVLSYFNKNIPEKHAAWIVSRLLSISCFFNYSEIVHNGICLRNCFISPKYHTLSLLGGWWYTTKKDEQMIGTTKEIYDVMSVSAKSKKLSNSITDLESIKLIGRQLLGESNCRELKKKKPAPEAFIDYLISGSDISAYKEIEKWDEALKKSYGKRVFIPLEIEKEKIYSMENIKEVF